MGGWVAQDGWVGGTGWVGGWYRMGGWVVQDGYVGGTGWVGGWVQDGWVSVVGQGGDTLQNAPLTFCIVDLHELCSCFCLFLSEKGFIHHSSKVTSSLIYPNCSLCGPFLTPRKLQVHSCSSLAAAYSTHVCSVLLAAAASIRKAHAHLGVPVVLVTPGNLSLVLNSTVPMHPAYQYLSSVHQSDYLRIYLWHLYGGGWFDVKPMYHSWRPSWEEFKDPDVWLIGPKERGPWDVAGNETVRSHFAELVATNQFIGRPRTPLSRDAHEGQDVVLSAKHHMLANTWKQNRRRNLTMPGRCCQSPHDISTFRYPLGWAELLGGVFHPACFQHRQHISVKMPRRPDEKYRDEGELHR